MAEQKTRPGTGDIQTILAPLDAARRADADALMAMMGEITGEPPVAWGSMIGFGAYHYVYETGHEGDAFLIGFAPRKAEFAIYLMGNYFPETEARREALLAKLGKHRMGKACLYVKKLADIDMGALRELMEMSTGALKARYGA